MPKFNKGDLVKIASDADSRVSPVWWVSGDMDKHKGKYAIVVDRWKHWRGIYVYTLNIDGCRYYWEESWLEKSFVKDDFILEE